MRGRSILVIWYRLLTYLAPMVCGCAISVLPAGLALLTGPAAFAQEALRTAKILRDWQKCPAIVELDTTADVYSMGDVHGDYDRLVALLAAGKVIGSVPDHPNEVRWNASQAVLVCTGDLIDKGGHSLKVIALFRALEQEAAKVGGRVIVLMGNHEAEFLADPDDDDKALVFLKELDKHGIRPRDVATGRDADGIGQYLRSLPFAARVNDWFFAHAGDTGGKTLVELRSALQADVDAKGFDAEILLGKKGLLEARLHQRPWWEKKGDEARDSEARLRHYVESLGVKHLVIGHQPGNVTFSDGSSRKKGTMVQKFDGLIFLIDVGMSEAIDYSRGAMLHIQSGENPSALAIYPAKGRERLWPKP